MLIQKGPPPSPGNPEFSCSFASKTEDKTQAREHILEYLLKHSIISERDIFWCRLVLDEAMVNAVIHGNRSDPDKTVTVQVYTDRNELTICVDDEGEGFQNSEVPSSEDDDALSREHGRGVELIHHYMDKVVYYSGGSVCIMTKRMDKKE
ncbi:ATP-binding protein [Planctomycetota bacterium]